MTALGAWRELAGMTSSFVRFRRIPLAPTGGRTRRRRHSGDSDGSAGAPRDTGLGETTAVGHVDLARVCYVLPDGRPLLYDVSFRVGEGAKAALLGANGTGKTTLLRLIAGDDEPAEGTIVRSGGLGVMRQFIGGVRDATTVRELLASVAPPAVRSRAAALVAAEDALAGATRTAPSSPTPRRSPTGATPAAGTPRCCGRPAAARRWACTLAGGADAARAHPLRRRAEAAGAGGAAARAPTRCCCSTSPTTTSTCPASAGSRSSCGDAEDRAVRLARPRADRAGRPPHRHGRGAHGLGARRRLRDLRRGAPRPHRPAGGAAPPLDARSTCASRSSCARCACRRRSRRRWPAATRPCRRACASSRRPARRPSRRATRGSRCACAAAAPACGP